MERLIIVADDLAGAADCAVAFAQRGFSTRAVFDAEEIERNGTTVLALDTDTRDASSELAHERVAAAVVAAAPRDALFKKVDSTLRGNVASEVGAVISRRPVECVIAAPAFPATGRTTRGGRQLLSGRPLEETEFAGQVSSSLLTDHLGSVGLAVRAVTVEAVRDGHVAGLVRDTASTGGAVLVCDAETEDDLDAIARGGLDSGRAVLWVGSAGLARRLAQVLPLRRRSGPARSDLDAAPLLLVVGSPAPASQSQLERLRRAPGVVEIVVECSDLPRSVRRVRDALRSGQDTALTLPRGQGERNFGRDGSALLASVAAPAAELAGGLVLTGGETARAVLGAMSVRGLTLEREIRPGIALARTDVPHSQRVALKAGGLGEDDALEACRSEMRRAEA